MMPNQRNRLLREDPWEAQGLAQELYAMFGDKDPLEIPEGIHLTVRDDGIPPIQIDDFTGDDTTIFKINRGDGEFSFSLDNSGDLVFKVGGQETPFGSGSGTGGGGSGTGNVFPGQVAAYIGANLYTMNVYTSGRTQPSVPLIVEQLEGDPLFPHAVGRWTLVCVEPDGSACMWMPVWG